MSYSSTEEDRKAEAEWERAATEKSAKTDEEAQQADVDEEEMNPKRRKIHKLFFFISVLAMFAALSMAVGQVIGLVFKNVGPIQWILRAYTIGLCFVVLFTEMEMSKLARENIILHNWISRGLIYSFIGVIGLEEIDTSDFKENPVRGVVPAQYFIKAVAWIMIGIGAMYFFMGIACFQQYYEKERVEYNERRAVAVINRRDRRRNQNKANAAENKA